MANMSDYDHIIALGVQDKMDAVISGYVLGGRPNGADPTGPLFWSIWLQLRDYEDTSSMTMANTCS